LKRVVVLVILPRQNDLIMNERIKKNIISGRYTIDMDKKKFFTKGEFIGHSMGFLNGYYDFIKGMINEDFLDSLRLKIESYFPINLFGIELFGALFVMYLKGRCKWKSIEFFNGLLFLKRREKGGRERIYGEIKEYDTYLIDDVITKGDTIRDALNVLEKVKIIPKGIFCMKNRGNLRKFKMGSSEIPIIEL